MKVKAIHSLVVGKAPKEKTIDAGTEFDTKSAGISATEVTALIAAGAMVEVAPPVTTPAAETEGEAPAPVPAETEGEGK